MARRVLLPPDEPATAEGIRAGGWWHETDDGHKLVCDLCPRGCALAGATAGSASCGRTWAAEWSRRPTAAAPASASIRSRRSRSTISIPARRSCRSARPAATWAASSARTGRSRSRGEVEPLQRGGRPGGRSPQAALRTGLPQRGLHLQRPGDLGRVRDRHGPGLPRAWASRPWRSPPATSRRRPGEPFLRGDGRGQRRSQGLHRRLLLEADRRPPRPGARHARAGWSTRRDVWVEITNLIIPQANDSADELRRDVRLDRRGAAARRAGALHGLSSRFPPERPRARRRRRRWPRPTRSPRQAGIRITSTRAT